MRKTGSLIRQFRENESGPITLRLDLLEISYKDMQEYGGQLSPVDAWDLDAHSNNQGDITFGDMLPLWIGSGAIRAITPDILEKYQPFLNECDLLELIPSFLDADIGEDYTRRIADLGTIIDVNLIVAHLQHRGDDSVHFLEIGGGYGRLAEAFMGLFGHQAKYVIVDAVPESLVYAYLYLSKNFPDRKIWFYYIDNSFDLRTHDCYIIPAWHFSELNSYQFDVCINVDSMQEMSQEQVEHYVWLFDQATRLGGEIYLSNSRDYHQREFNYPKHWCQLYKRRTPQSWTPDYPTEIFRKADRDCSQENLSIETQYMNELQIAYREAYAEKTRLLTEARSRIKQLAEEKRADKVRAALRPKWLKLVLLLWHLKEKRSRTV